MGRTRSPRSKEEFVENKVEDTKKSFKIRERSSPVRIRAGAGIEFDHVGGKYLGKGIFEVDEVADGNGSKTGWGHLANGEGWVALDYVDILK